MQSCSVQQPVTIVKISLYCILKIWKYKNIQKYGAKITELIRKYFNVEVIPEIIYITTKKNLIILEL